MYIASINGSITWYQNTLRISGNKRQKLSKSIRKIMWIQNDNRATSQADTDSFSFLLVTPFRQQSVNSLKKRLVKSFSRSIKFTVAFKDFVLVFISKELLPKSRILVKLILSDLKVCYQYFSECSVRLYSIV